MSIPDNYSQWESYDREQTQQLERQPRCSICEQHIQEDFLYVINDEPVCEECLERDFRRCVEDYVC